MTTRKPPTMSFPDWIEHQIRTAEAEGAFENLPGAGKPIPGIDKPQDDLAWVADYLRRESGASIAEVLPPALALAKEVETLPERLAKERTETAARAVIDNLNERISRAHAQPQVGPPLRVKLVNVDAALDRWREARAQQATTTVKPPEPPEPPPARRRWRRRNAS